VAVGLEEALFDVEPPAILISIRPQFVEAITTGLKTIELRRRFPMVAPNRAVLIYSSTPVRAVVATARIVQIHAGSPTAIWNKVGADAAITRADFRQYFAGSSHAFGIELGSISKLSSPISLKRLRGEYSMEPPQSWRYVLNSDLASVANGC
jgi:predicted transcriptional regulator